MSLRETAEAGDRVKTLRTLRDRLADQIDLTDSARDVAALSQRLMDVLGQIESLEKAQPAPKGTPLDELANRRAGRGSDSAGSGRAVKSSD